MNKTIQSVISHTICILCLAFLFNNSAMAQTPQYYNSNAIQLPNAFPFNTALGKKVQMLYKPGEFNLPSPAPAGNIASLSFLIANTLGPFTYNNFTIRIGRTNITDLVSGIWYEGQLDTVYHRSSVQLSSPSGQWMTIQLDRTFTYDPAQSIVIEVQQCGAPGASGFSFASGVVFGNRRHVSLAGESCPLPYGTSDGILHNIGFTLGPMSGTGNIANEIPDSYKLSQNFPNPFNPSTTINYSVSNSGIIKLNVFDVLGKEVASLVNDYKQAGNYSVDFNASDLSSGVYYYEMLAGEFREMKMMTLIR